MKAEQKVAGFTLIELMIAVAIIGIMASVAIPSYTGYLLRARDSAAYLHLPELGKAAKAYYHTEFAGAGATDGMATHCMTMWANSPGHTDVGVEPFVPDWENETVHNADAFRALGFAPPGPLYHSFHILSTIATITTDINGNPTPEALEEQCGQHEDERYFLSTRSDLDGDGTLGWRVYGLFAEDGDLVTKHGGVLRWTDAW